MVTTDKDQTIFELQAAVTELRAQRDRALDDCVLKSMKLALAGRKIGSLEVEVKKLEDQLPVVLTE